MDLADALEWVAYGLVAVGALLLVRLVRGQPRRQLSSRDSPLPALDTPAIAARVPPPPVRAVAQKRSIDVAQEIFGPRRVIEATTPLIDADADERPIAGETPPLKPFYIGTGTGFTMAIVGESYRQTALRALAGERRRRGEEVVFDAVVYAEPTNSYDPNAVRIDDSSGRQLGYLSRDDALAYKALFGSLHTAGRIGCCRAKLIGGTSEKPSIGVILDLEEQNELVARLSAEDQPF